MYDRIRTYLSQQLDIPVEEMSRDTTFESLHLDSLDMMEMVMDMEEELGVEVGPFADHLERLEVLPVGEDADDLHAGLGHASEVVADGLLVPVLPHAGSGVGGPVVASDFHGVLVSLCLCCCAVRRLAGGVRRGCRNDGREENMAAGGAKGKTASRKKRGRRVWAAKNAKRASSSVAIREKAHYFIRFRGHSVQCPWWGADGVVARVSVCQGLCAWFELGSFRLSENTT